MTFGVGLTDEGTLPAGYLAGKAGATTKGATLPEGMSRRRTWWGCGEAARQSCDQEDEATERDGAADGTRRSPHRHRARRGGTPGHHQRIMKNGHIATKTKSAPARWESNPQNVGCNDHSGRSGRIWSRVGAPDGGLHHARGRIRRRGARVRPVRTWIPTSDVAAAGMRDARLPRRKSRMAPRARLKRSSEAQGSPALRAADIPSTVLAGSLAVLAEGLRHLDRRGRCRRVGLEARVRC